jgi:hypothetical protein
MLRRRKFKNVHKANKGLLFCVVTAFWQFLDARVAKFGEALLRLVSAPQQGLPDKAVPSYGKLCARLPCATSHHLSRCAEVPQRILPEGPPMYLLCSVPLYSNLISHIAVSYMSLMETNKAYQVYPVVKC